MYGAARRHLRLRFAGNQIRFSSYMRTGLTNTGSVASQELASYHDAAQRLRAADRQACIRWPPEARVRHDLYRPAVPVEPFGLCPPEDKRPCSDRDEALGRPLIGEEILLMPLAAAAGVVRGVTGGVVRAFAADATGAAASSVTEFATKAAARSALAEMGLPDAQAAAVNRAIGRATTKTTIGIAQGEDGNVIVTLTRAGRDGQQVIESVVSQDGTKTVVQKGINAEGVVEHYDPK
jgi:hypothetical protein